MVRNHNTADVVVQQAAVLVKARNMEKLAEIIGEYMLSGYFIGQIIKQKVHTLEAGDMIEAIVLMTKVVEEQ